MSQTIISQAGFLAFIRSPVNIPPIILPDDDWSIPFAYQMATEMVNTTLCRVSPFMYQQAVYNLGMDVLINVAQDQDGRTVFKDKRKEYKIDGFVPGVISTSSNAGTAESLFNPDVFKGFLLSDLKNLKTPWGRMYLEIADNAGSLWGLS